MMELGRVLLILCLSLGFCNAGALSLDLEGLGDEATSHINAQKLMEIVSGPTLSSLLGRRKPLLERLYHDEKLHWNIVTWKTNMQTRYTEIHRKSSS